MKRLVNGPEDGFAQRLEGSQRLTDTIGHVVRVREATGGHGPEVGDLGNEHSEQARAPHTNGPRDVPRRGL